MTLERDIEAALASVEDAVEAARQGCDQDRLRHLGREAFIMLKKASEQVKAENRKAEFRDRLHVAARSLLTEVFKQPVEPS